MAGFEPTSSPRPKRGGVTGLPNIPICTEGRTRTGTGVTAQQILSLSCLPFHHYGNFYLSNMSKNILCEPNRNRTCNLRIRSALLYPVELWVLLFNITKIRNKFGLHKLYFFLCNFFVEMAGFEPASCSVKLKNSFTSLVCFS